MTLALDQLHYTWTPRGVEGMNRFQIAAMTAGLKTGPRASLLPVVRKLCRYDPPRGKVDVRPISYGWFDFRDHRIAFCRVGLDAQKGKVGNFAAHVLVGEPELLPEHELALRFGSSFWWRGATPQELESIKAGRRDFELPQIELGDIPPGAQDAHVSDPGEADSLAHALFTLPAKTKLAVTGDSYALGDRLQTIARCYPEALEGLSLSTYEGAATFPFRIMGTRAPTPSHRTHALDSQEKLDSVSRATLENLRESATSNGWLHTAATDATRAVDDSREAFWHRARGLVAASRGLSMEDIDLTPLLNTPSGTAYLASQPPGRERIAEAIQASDADVGKALRMYVHTIEPSDLKALYESTIERYRSTRKLGGCTAAAEVFAGGPNLLPQALLDAILDVTITDPETVETLEAEDLVALIVRAAKCKLAAEQLSPLLKRASTDVDRLAVDKHLPTSYIVTIFRSALCDEKPAMHAKLVAALVARRGLLEKVALNQDEHERCLDLLDALNGRDLEAALSALLIGLAQKQPGSLREVLARLPLTAASRIIVEQAREGGPDLPAIISELCDVHAAALLRQQLSTGQDPARDLTRLAVGLLECSRSDDHPKAHDLLKALYGRASQPLRVAEATAEIASPELRAALAALAVDKAIAQVHRESDVGRIWAEMHRQDDDATDEVVLRWLLTRAVANEQTECEPILRWLATQLLPACGSSLWASSRIRDREIQEMCLALAVRVPLWRIEQEDPRIAAGARRIRSWWRGLVEHCRKTQPRTRIRRSVRHPLRGPPS